MSTENPWNNGSPISEETLSEGQRALWLMYKMDPDSGAYNMCYCWHLKSGFLKDEFTEVIRYLTKRHPVLRSVYRTNNNEPVRCEYEDVREFISEEDISGLNENDLDKLLWATMYRPFDLENDPPVKWILFSRDGQPAVLFLLFNHIGTDLCSVMMMMNEIRILFRQKIQGEALRLPPLTKDHSDFVAYEKSVIGGSRGQELISFWENQLSDDLPLLSLPTDHARPPRISFSGGSHRFHLSRGLTKSLEGICSQFQLSPFVVYLAAFRVLLQKYTSQRDIVIGVPTAGRLEEFYSIFGYYVNPVAIRTQSPGDPAFLDFARYLGGTVSEVLKHQDCPFPVVVKQLGQERDPSRAAVFQVNFVWENPNRFFNRKDPLITMGDRGLEHWDLGEMLWERVHLKPMLDDFDLTLKVVKLGADYHCMLDYNLGLYQKSTAQRIAGHFVMLLEQICKAPSASLSQLDILTEEERKVLLESWNQDLEPYPPEFIFDLVEQHGVREPDAAAIICEKRTVSYAVLNKKANQLAHRLIQCGVGPDDLVGLFMNRSESALIGLLAVLKSGGGYVPLDPNYPTDRTAYMISDSRVKVVITELALLDKLAVNESQTLIYDAFDSEWHNCPDHAPKPTVHQENVAYVIYTSGTTGKPKGVMIKHRCVANLMYAESKITPITPEDQVLIFGSLSFDTSIWAIICGWHKGATLHTATREVLMGDSLMNYLVDQEISLVLLPPSLLATFSWVNLPKLKYLFVGGEACSWALAKEWGQGNNLFNGYGPTETTCWASWCLLDGSRQPHIGKPVPNALIYILDEHLNQTPVGVPGELIVGGYGVSRGYLDRPDLTATVFLPDPFSPEPGARMYKTGDLCRYLTDGNIDFLGRVDHQVKIRGFRIELEEIEVGIRNHNGARDCLVLVRKEHGSDILVGFVVREADWPHDNDSLAEDLRDHLMDRMPEYMVPSAFLIMDKFPMTSNDKIDRRKLAAMELNRVGLGKGGVAPRTPIEEVIASIWSQVLKLEHVGVTDSFFAIGGHSLLATQVISRMKTAFQVELPVPEFFKAPTIAAMARWVSNARNSGLQETAIKPAKRGPFPPLSFAQRQLWFIDQLTPGNSAYNVPLSFRLSGSLDVKVLNSALAKIVYRHEVMRTTFALGDEGPYQLVNDDIDCHLKEIDLFNLPHEDWRDEIQREAVEEGLRPFDLVNGPLFRFSILGLSQDEHIFLLTMHHVISDGWSVGIFLNELMHCYEAERGHKPGLLSDLQIQYIDYTYWQNQRLQGDVLTRLLAFWKNELAGNSFVLELPSDRSRPKTQSHEGATVHFALDQGLVSDMKDLGKNTGATLFMTLFSAFNVLLYRYTGQRDLLVGTPIANRGSAELEELIGCFVNTLALRTNLMGEPHFKEVINQVRSKTLDAYAHQDLPFELLVEELQPERDLSRNPLFQIMFVLQNAPMPEFELSNLTLEPLEIERGVSHFDLEVSMVETSDGIKGTFEFCTALFDRAMIARMSGHFKHLLKSVTGNPDEKISHLQLLCEEERRRLLLDRNDTAFEYPRDRAVPQLIEDAVKRWPGDIAVTFEDSSLTYAELDKKATQLASYLRKKGVGPDVLVGLCMERSLEMMVTLLGIFKAGGGYLPLDPGFPRERLVYMLEDARVGILVTQTHLTSYLGEHGAETISIDGDWKEIAKEPSKMNSVPPIPESVSYMIYTSGSTGRPKGVQLTHGNLLNLLLSIGREPGMKKDDRLVAVTTLSFDISKVEMFLPLMVGAQIFIASRDVAMNGERLLELVKSSKATHCQATPVSWRLLLAGGWGLEPRLKIFSGGEPIAPELGEGLVARGTLWNMYGPSETTIYSVIYRVRSAKETIAIGKGVNNTTLYILDGNLQPTPEGVPGELYIGGEGVGRGYYQRPGLTAEKFVPNPFSDQPGDRIYASGDLVRYLADGNIDCIGRIDHQVKVRGYRIELGEIEAVLIEHQAVKQVVVIVREDTPGDKRLVAYLVPETEAPELTSLQELAKQTLPSYMIPAAFVVIDAMPQTPSGKIDRKRLPEPSGDLLSEDEQVTIPANMLEEKIVQIWCEVLKVKRVGTDQNFFDVGGNSLLLTQVAAKLQDFLKKPVPVITLFQHTTIQAIAQHLGDSDTKPSGSTAERMEAKNTGPIAIIGMVGRFPDADNISEYWDHLISARECVTMLSDQDVLESGVSESLLADPDYIKARGILRDVSLFDHHFFGYTPREAQTMDPQQRLFLETAWEALEVAGHGPGASTDQVAVFGSVRFSSYFLENLASNPDLLKKTGPLQMMVGNDKDFLTTRISYKLNLKGPSTLVQTGCSSSLVAVHQACRALLSSECELALAGGVSVSLPQKTGYLYEEGSIFSPDGHCRPFDAKAAGTVGGSGVGIVVLKNLEAAIADGDTVHGVIYGSAVNNDGANKVGFTAPSVSGQEQVIHEAHYRAWSARHAEIKTLTDANLIEEPKWVSEFDYAETVSYIEAHGTGTRLGDPTEVQALTQAFSQNMGVPRSDHNRARLTQHCALGSVKGNIGHLDPAAGIAGLIKAVLAVKHRVLPASLHYETPNPEIPFSTSPFYVNHETKPWETPGFPRLAGVSSFGIGGTNAHIVVQEPASDEYYQALLSTVRGHAGTNSVRVDRNRHLLVLSAKTHKALERVTEDMVTHLKREPDQALADVAHTLQRGRKAWEHRRMVVCRDHDDAVEALETQSSKRVLTSKRDPKNRRVIFMFSGQGSQYPEMAKDLYRTESMFRDVIDEGSELLLPLLDLDLRDLLLYTQDEVTEDVRARSADQLNQTQFSQPALFLVEYALASLWMSWGVHPWGMIGHSIGEYVAACLAGVFSFEDALKLVVKRGRVMQACPPGDMLAVPLPEAEVTALLVDHPDVSMATINAPKRCVVAGPQEAIDHFIDALESAKVRSTRLHTSHAFHSAMMDTAKSELIHFMEGMTLETPGRPQSRFVNSDPASSHAPQIFISNVSGDWMDPKEVTQPLYWGDHLRRAVRFSTGITKLTEEEELIFLEIGPGRTLETFTKSHTAGRSGHRVHASVRHPKKDINDLEFLFHSLGELWLDGIAVDWTGLYERRSSGSEKIVPRERRRRVPLPTYPFERSSHWVKPGIGGRGGSGPDLTVKLPIDQWSYIPSWRVLPASKNTDTDSSTWLIFCDPNNVAEQFVSHLKTTEATVLMVTPGECFKQVDSGRFILNPTEVEDYAALISLINTEYPALNRIAYFWSLGSEQDALEANLFNLIWLAQALAVNEFSDPIQLDVISDRAHDVTGNDDLDPDRAMIFAPVKVIADEFANINCRNIDVCVPTDANGIDAFHTLLRNEILIENPPMLVALRGSQRWGRDCFKHPLKVATDKPEALREGAVILVTGGLGAVGLELAEYLAGACRAKLVLLGRSVFPAREQWGEWLESHGSNDTTSKKILKIQVIENLGASVRIEQADIADENAMSALVTRVGDAVGEIHGVVHAAGVPGGHILPMQSREITSRCLSAKRSGTLVLDRVLDLQALDFIILCSSIASLGGGVGQVDYCAANVFLDAFAQKVRSKGVNCISICWDTWAEVGMAANMELPPSMRVKHEALLKLAMRSSEARDVFARVLSRLNWPVAVISTYDFETKLNGAAKMMESNLDDVTAGVAEKETTRVEPAGDFHTPRTDTEEIVAEYMAEALGFDRLGAFDDFQDLGGDSLLATSIAGRLRKHFKIKLSAAELMEASSVDALAEKIDEIRGAKRDPLPARPTGKAPVGHPSDHVGQSPPVEETPPDSNMSSITETEKTLLGIWQSALGVDTLSTRVGFRDLGGSDKAEDHMIGDIRQHFNIQISRNVFKENASLEMIAQQLDQIRSLAEDLKSIPDDDSDAYEVVRL